MANNSIPPRPTGSDPEAFFMQRVWDCCFGVESTVQDSPDIIVQKTTRGTAWLLRRKLALVSPGGMETYRVKSVVADDSGRGNVLVCRTWDGTTEGATDVHVAKHFTCQQIASETIDSILITYTYSGAATLLNRTRTATGTGINEVQAVVPYWQVNGLITVATVNFSNVTKSGADLKLMEVSSRCWAQI